MVLQLAASLDITNDEFKPAALYAHYELVDNSKATLEKQASSSGLLITAIPRTFKLSSIRKLS